jgi:uncharacterized surface protein with fasciclin (FAS1) repeats
LELFDVGAKKGFLVGILVLVSVAAFCTGMVEIVPEEEAAGDAMPPAIASSHRDRAREIERILDRPQFSLFLEVVASGDFLAQVAASAPATLFVPIDGAFELLPMNALQDLAADPVRRRRVLEHHLVRGSYTPAELAEAGKAITSLDVPLPVSGAVSDLYASWGRIALSEYTVLSGPGEYQIAIYPVNRVLLPPEETLEETLEMDGRFSVLLSAARVAGLEIDSLEEDGLTLLAPTDQAFARLSEGQLAELLANPDRLLDILENHLVDGWLLLGDFRYIQEVRTLADQTLMVSESGASVRLNRLSDVTEANKIATNGVIHVVNRVILPRGE